MTNSFDQLKSSRTSQFQKLAQEAEKINSKASNNSGADDRFWKPTIDKLGNGSAIIRFLPAPVNEDVPFVRYWDHGFQGPGGWYIEKSLTSIGEEDPVSQYNSKLWNSGNEADKEVARKQKRRLHYVSNIYVISDPGNPDNEGKVFLYEYGKKIFDKLNDLMHPQFEDEEAVNPFDLWEGANFRLRIRQVEGYRNYDKSAFDAPSAPADDDSALESIWKSEHSLTEFLDRKNFKSYDELHAKLYRVIGEQDYTTHAEQNTPEPPRQQTAWSAPNVSEAKVSPSDSPSFDDDDDSLNFFKKLAEG
jgi:hypothetical protein